jgi:hypothetical protein
VDYSNWLKTNYPNTVDKPSELVLEYIEQAKKPVSYFENL